MSFFKDDHARLKQAAIEDANITHNHPDARDASYFLCYMISELFKCKTSVFDVIDKTLSLDYEYDHIKRSVIKALECGVKIDADPVKELGVRGTAHETLSTAIYCFITTDNFKDCAVKSALLGGDSDTRAAIACAIAGTYYGLEGIPDYYINDLEDHNIIMELDRKLIGV